MLFLAAIIKGTKEIHLPKRQITQKKKLIHQNQHFYGKTDSFNKSRFLTKVANYEQNPDKWVYLGDKPCIIDFYADWCGPCKMIAPVLEELAQEYEEQIYIYKVDTDAEQELAEDFGIRSIPTLLFCPVGENPQMAQGALPKDVLKNVIDEILLKKS